jgi:hypothetical protein
VRASAQTHPFWRDLGCHIDCMMAAQNGGSARAYWSAHHAVSVPTIIGADGTVASIACTFMQVTLYRERSHTP